MTTSYLDFPHGQAVAMTISDFFKFNYEVSEKSVNDIRGVKYVKSTIEDLRANLEKKEDELLRQENRIDELIKQQDQSQVIIMSMEKDRQLLVESRRSPFSKLLNFIGVGS